MSGVSVGVAVVGSCSVAALPMGTDVSIHAYVSGLPSGSLEPRPSRETGLPTVALRSGPASATGGRFAARTPICTVSGALDTKPSLTMSCATYVPERSGTNVGWIAVGFDSVDALPTGTESNDHWNVNG